MRTKRSAEENRTGRGKDHGNRLGEGEGGNMGQEKMVESCCLS